MHPSEDASGDTTVETVAAATAFGNAFVAERNGRESGGRTRFQTTNKGLNRARSAF